MIRLSFIIAALFILSSGNSQLLSGSVAPNFTATDLNGNVHTLSTYLNSNKPVILDFNAVGCGPCWTYHRNDHLDDFYKAFGPLGSNEAMVLFIESGYSDVADLNGISNPPAFGNWVEGTTHPIILDSQGAGNLEDLYDIMYNPTMYRICPDGHVFNIMAMTAVGLRNSINGNCTVLNGVANHVIALETENGFCNQSGSFVAKIKNYGSNNVTNATLNLKQNGVVVATKTFSGSFPQFSTQDIAFDPVIVEAGSTYSYEISSVNGTSNHLPAFSSANLKYHQANPLTGPDLTVKIYTYVCPNNMSWSIKDSADNVVYTAGPYQGGGSGLCGGPLANSVITHNVTLPPIADCYSIELMDSNGYGWKNYSGNSTTLSGIQVLEGSNMIYENLNVGNFGSLLTLENVITSSSLGTASYDIRSAVDIFPNPTNGIVTIDSELPFNLNVYDIAGKNVAYFKSGRGRIDFNLTNLEKGVYFVHIEQDDAKTIIKKLIKQ